MGHIATGIKAAVSEVAGLKLVGVKTVVKTDFRLRNIHFLARGLIQLETQAQKIRLCTPLIPIIVRFEVFQQAAINHNESGIHQILKARFHCREQFRFPRAFINHHVTAQRGQVPVGMLFAPWFKQRLHLLRGVPIFGVAGGAAQQL
ncbi:MAG: hypothetical protein BWX80_03902 [Candidatus Hydrogenedentes bacterium ADurb.Bin101]|nr:MAG: hypothetical protein BWX80_03902 [Candidatus Hydrogenedentes bacterium ADurb.Bin101]